MKVHVLDLDPRQHSEPEIYKTNYGSFGAIAINMNKALKQIGHYADPDDADFVGICDGLNLSFNYKGKPSFVINVWDWEPRLPDQLVIQREACQQRVFGLSTQISKLWEREGVECPTVWAGCDTEFWKPSGFKQGKFTFLSVNFANVRSGVELGILAFLRAFSKNKNVQLIVKNTSDDPRFVRFVNGMVLKSDNIVLINKRMNMEELRQIYSRAHVCLNVMRHSSLGLPIWESSACNCLSINGDFCPSNDMVSPDHSVFLSPSGKMPVSECRKLTENFGLVNAYGNLISSLEEPWIYDYNIDEYADLLTKIYEQWDRFSVIDTRSPIVEKWKWEKSARKLVEGLSEQTS